MTEQADLDYLRQLGGGERIESLCRQNDWTRETFNQWWQSQLHARLPVNHDSLALNVSDPVEIERDAWGIPHIFATNDRDLFVGFGFSLAQDRLFQLDYLRRKATGQLAEILGPAGLESDRMVRTVGLAEIARQEWDTLGSETQQLLESFTAGINAALEHTPTLPIECALLDYRPAPWTPLDSLAIECEFRWYLTGRFPVIVAPELAKRALGDGSRLEQLLLGEADQESIMPAGSYQSAASPSKSPGGVSASEFEGHGSNNWTVHGSRSANGSPLVASDPHIAFEAVSCWYEAHLQGGSFDVAGMAYVGMPAIMFGRNRQVGWSITNNICSQRDLYQEKTDANHPGCFLYDDQWEPAQIREEIITVRGADDFHQEVTSSRNGPIVDHILPEVAQQTGPVSLTWLGATQGGWLTALLDMGRTSRVSEFQEALEPWHVPTFSLIVADTEGHIGFHAAGRIPIRDLPERGYRPGWDPAHQWQGLIPFSDMPRLFDPPRGWIASANNRLASDDYPFPLSGCWSSGHRATRIRHMLTATEKHTVETFRKMQLDTVSLRAVDGLPPLRTALQGGEHPQLPSALKILEPWTGEMKKELVAPTLFNTFFRCWCERVAAEHFDESTREFMAASVGGVAARLLHEDNCQWFKTADREQQIRLAFYQALEKLTGQLGDDLDQWTWGRIQVIRFPHVLAERGDLGQLLNPPAQPVDGDMVTVCNTGFAATGAGYRLIHDLGSQPPEMVAIDCQSQSGHPGSPHYNDQFTSWAAGHYHRICLDREDSEVTQSLVPR
ncbi:MAG: penicillin acylase family protein [Pirellulaceae bacterium]